MATVSVKGLIITAAVSALSDIRRGVRYGEVEMGGVMTSYTSGVESGWHSDLCIVLSLVSFMLFRAVPFSDVTQLLLFRQLFL